MNKAIYLLFVAVFAALLPASCGKARNEGPAPETASPGLPGVTAADVLLEGVYVGGGTDAEGNAYICEVEITPAKEVYWVTYNVDDRIPYPGVALRRGDLFVVGYRDERDVYGVVVYTINVDGSLEAVSADQYNTKTGTEKLQKK